MKKVKLNQEELLTLCALLEMAVEEDSLKDNKVEFENLYNKLFPLVELGA